MFMMKTPAKRGSITADMDKTFGVPYYFFAWLTKRSSTGPRRSLEPSREMAEMMTEAKICHARITENGFPRHEH